MSLMRNAARLQWPTGTQIFGGFKLHDLITCKSKVQGIVAPGRQRVLFALGR